jgi:hypothetical protein
VASSTTLSRLKRSATTKVGREVEISRKADSISIDFESWYGMGDRRCGVPVVLAFISVDWSQAEWADEDTVFSHKAKVLMYSESAGTYVQSIKPEVKSEISSTNASTLLPLFTFMNKYSILDDRISQAYELVFLEMIDLIFRPRFSFLVC